MEEGARWERGCLETPAGVRVDRIRGATQGLGRWGSGRGVPGKARAAVPRAPRTEAGRGAPQRPSGAPLGAETRAGRGGRVRAWTGWAWGLSWISGGTQTRSPSRLAGLGRRRRWAPAEPLKFRSLEKDRVPGEEKCAGEERDLLGQAGVSASLSRPNSAAAASELFWKTCCFPLCGGRGCLGGKRGGGRGARRGESCELRQLAQGRLYAVGSGQWSEDGFVERGEA